MKRILIAAGLAAAMAGLPAGAETPLERGAYLVEGPAGCGNCHSPKGPDAAPLSGWVLIDAGLEIPAHNITPGGRVGQWSDAELARAIREGIRPDGSVIGPPMPIHGYRHLSDGDLAAIVAYLRTVPAVETEFTPAVYPFPLPPNWGPPVDSVAEVPRGRTVEYGAYLAGPVAHCTECHSLVPGKGPDWENNFGGGGYEFEGPWGISVAANITNGPDGLAGYSDAEIAAMITEGRRPDGSEMLPPMPYHHFARMTEDDVAAVILYLRTVPPLEGN